MVPHFPGVGQQQVHLGLGKVEPVLPQVPVLDVGVEPDLFIIGLDGGDTRVASEDAPVGEHDFAVVGGGIGGVGDGIGQQQVGALVALRWVQPDEGVAEHGRGAVQIRGRKHQGYGFGVQGLAPGVVGRAIDGVLGQRQLRAQPAVAGGKAAAGVVVATAGCLNCGQGSFQLGLGRVLAVRAQEKVRVVCLAGVAAAEPVGLVVSQGEPGRVPGEGVRGGGIRQGTHSQPEQGWRQKS